jgi:hypothetical protein
MTDQAFVAGGSGWGNQAIDLLSLAQQAALSREELAFKRWAAEKGFEIDEKNREWLKEQFYQSQEFERQNALGYMQASPFGQQLKSTGGGSSSASGSGYYSNPNAPVLNDEMAARRAIWDNKGNVRKLWKDRRAPSDEEIYDLVGRWLQSENKGQTGMAYAIDKGWGQSSTPQTTSTIPGAAGVDANGQPTQDWMKTLEREVAEWNNTLQQQGLGLNYLQMLSQMRGPRDWVQYANTVRAAEGSQLPAWAQALVGGQNVPQFQGAGDGGYQSIWNQPAQTAQGAMAATPNLAALGQQPPMSVPGEQVVAQQPVAVQATQPSWSQSLANNPQGIRYQQWSNLMPFEQEMLRGALEQEGVDWNTYLQQVQRTWVPRQSVVPISSWQ